MQDIFKRDPSQELCFGIKSSCFPGPVNIFVILQLRRSGSDKNRQTPAPRSTLTPLPVLKKKEAESGKQESSTLFRTPASVNMRKTPEQVIDQHIHKNGLVVPDKHFIYVYCIVSQRITIKDNIPVEEGKPIYWSVKPRQSLTAEAPHVAFVAEQGTCLVSLSVLLTIEHTTGPFTSEGLPCHRPQESL